MDFKIYFYDLRKLQFNKIFFKKETAGETPIAVYILKGEKIK